MASREDRAYFEQRQTEEILAAALSKGATRASHMEMAYRYARLIAKLDELGTPGVSENARTDDQAVSSNRERCP